MLTFRTVWVFALWAHFFLDHAETRWCNALGKGPADTLNYSAIAKAARVTGVIIARVTSMPSGKVLQVEPVFHVHPLLLDPVENKLESWAIKTDAVGEEPCQCLIIVEFQLRDNVSPTEPPLPPTPLGILRLRVSAETIILYSLPGNSAQQQETEMASLYSTAPLCVGNGHPIRRSAFLFDDLRFVPLY